jgi:hypothetical protein
MPDYSQDNFFQVSVWIQDLKVLYSSPRLIIPPNYNLSYLCAMEKAASLGTGTNSSDPVSLCGLL